MAIATSTTLLWGGGIFALEACSSDNTSGTSGTVTPTPDAAGHDASSSTDTSTPPDDTDSSVPATDAGADCGKAASLHPNAGDGGIYCPFSAPAGGKNVYCAETQQCCENPAGGAVSTCVAKGAACPVAAATVWECEDPTDCAGMKCCAHASDGGTVTLSTDTCGPYLSKFSGTRCAAACAAGELQVCEKQGDCASGTCTAVKPKGNDIGVCK